MTVSSWLTADRRRFDLLVAVLTVGGATLLILAAPEEPDTGWLEVAAGVAAFVMLLFRRRWPFALLTVTVAASWLHVVLLDRPTPMLMAAFVMLATTAVRLERWPAIALGAVVGLAFYAAALIATEFGAGDQRTLFPLAWAACAVGVGDATRSWRRYRSSIDDQMAAAVVAAEADAHRQITEERLEIARELHDLLAHNLSVMNVQTGAAAHLLRSDPDAAEAALNEARRAGRGVLDELSELLAVLRREDGEAPRNSLPGVEQIADLVDTMRSSGLEVTYSSTGTERELTPGASLAAYRVAQEGLTNAAKHGDGRVVVHERWTDDSVTLTVTNHNGSTTSAGGGHGLLGMRERVIGNGGTFDAGSNGDEFVVTATLPVSQRTAASDEGGR